MKRFFCTVCNKIKRVRKYPKTIEHSDATLPSARRGVCKRHVMSDSLIRSLGRKVGE